MKQRSKRMHGARRDASSDACGDEKKGRSTRTGVVVLDGVKDGLEACAKQRIVVVVAGALRPVRERPMLRDRHCDRRVVAPLRVDPLEGAAEELVRVPRINLHAWHAAPGSGHVSATNLELRDQSG